MLRLTRRKLLVATGFLLILVAAVVISAGWIYSGMLANAALRLDHEDPLNLEVVAVRAGELTLRPLDKEATRTLSKPGLWGLQWEEGYVQLSDALTNDGAQVTRRLVPGSRAPAAGARARLDSFAFAPDPSAVGLPFNEVLFESERGSFPAWHVAGAKETWVIFVHGQTATRAQALRLLPTAASVGYSCLVITYRNDLGVPTSESGYYDWGKTEWRDVEGAARYAIAHGAKQLILVGYSMGGGIVVNFLYQSELRNSVRAIVLDAPVLDFNATVDLGAQERGIPTLLTAIGKRFASWRFGVAWEELDYLRQVSQLRVPILLFHGSDDDRAPIAVSEALARTRPDLVEYHRVTDATHVRSWNMGPGAYEDLTRRFLAYTAP